MLPYVITESPELDGGEERFGLLGLILNLSAHKLSYILITTIAKIYGMHRNSSKHFYMY